MGDQPDLDNPDGSETGGDEPKIPQSQASAIATREAAQAERRTKQAIADQLGCTIEEAAQRLQAIRDADEATKTEAERALSAANTAKTEAERLKAEAAAEKLAAKIERKLTAAGVPETALARATRMVTLDPGADDDAITAEIDALKTEIPALFAAPADELEMAPPPPPPPPGAGGGPGPQHTKAVTGIEAGREMARKRADARPSTDPFARFKPAGAA